MGDILPLKRQAVVDRLRRRFDLQYRRHQEGCYPRYEQAANGLFEQQRHETQILKQRYLEAKAKKLKKSEQKNTKDPCVNNASADSQRSLLVQKLNKRQADGSPIGIHDTLTNSDEGSDPRPKIQRKSQSQEQNSNREQLSNNNNNNNNNNTQSQQNQQQLPSFSVQIVQQFTSSSSAQSQHSQTIQTNVTVKALSGNIKSSNSPLDGAASAATATKNSTSGSGPQGDDLQLTAGASISVGTNIECKRERDTEFRQCSNFSHRDQGANPTSGGLGTSNGGGGTADLGHGHGDRFADTFANLACFPEDSNDDVINSDILSDINTNDFFDDIFTNPSDLMKEFSFDDSVGSVRDHSEEGDKDPSLGNAVLADMGKGQPNAFQFPSQQGLGFETQRGAGPPGMVGAGSAGFPPRMTGYSPLSPTLAGLDFKLHEPSPAAQTLKQMAEQHQSMQQKQHQIGLGLGAPHPSRSPFGSDSFSDPLTLSSMRTTFLNGANMNSLSKVAGAGGAGPGPLYNSLPFAQQAGPQTPGGVQPGGHSPAGHSPGSYVAGLRSGAGGGMVFKQETGAAFPRMSGQLNSSDSMDIHKRQNVQRITPDPKPHMDQYGTAPSPVDQKPTLTQSPVASAGGGASAGPQSQQQQQQQARQPSPSQASSQAPYAGTRPLSHFTDHAGVHPGLQASPSANSRGSPSSMPTLPGSGTFIRGLTPPPSGGPQHFSTTVPTRSPSRTTNLQISQSQQLQISQSNHQLQASQSQQIQLSQELKPSTPTHTPPTPQPQSQQAPAQGSAQASQGNHEGSGVYGSYGPNGNFQLSMSQTQNVSFTSHQYGSPTGASTPPSGQMDPSRTHPVVSQQQQQHMASAQRGPAMQQQQQQHNFMNRPPPPEYKGVGKQAGPRYPGPGRSGPMGPYSGPEQRASMPGGPILPGDVLQPQFNPQTLNVSMAQQQQMTVKGTGNQKPVYASTLHRNRAPNVNVGPEGLNISQKPPFEWRQMMLQQQQHQHQQQQQQQQQRMTMVRYPQCYNRPMQPGSNPGQFLNGPMVRVGLQPQPQQQQRMPVMVPRAPQQHQLPRHLVVQQQMMMQSAIGNLDSNPGVAHPAQQSSQQQQQMAMQLSSTSSTSSIALDPSSAIQFGDSSLQTAQSGSGDSNSFCLDFLDNIESSASDLLTFDTVSGAHFSLLDEMGMLGK